MDTQEEGEDSTKEKEEEERRRRRIRRLPKRFLKAIAADLLKSI